ncbi:hypothetical protein B566_EDAN004586 [Ephemera danica]|nr:hypothetical protein B566_EDAN004586 [Ephemera danica]
MQPTRRLATNLVSLGLRAASSHPVLDPVTHVLRSPVTDVELVVTDLADFIWRKADKWKHWPALTDAVTGCSFTYGEARAASERLSVSLPDSAGLQPGDVLALVMPNSPEFAFALLGAAAAGIVVTPANPLYTAEELSRQLRDAGAKAVVTVPSYLDKVREALERSGGAQLIVSCASEADEVQLGPDVLSLRALLSREYTRRTPRLPRPDPDQLVVLPYSSGTTGLPKGVRITHRNMVANLCQMEHPDVVATAPEGTQDVTVSVLPFFHIYGMNGVLNLSLSLGRHTVILPRFEAGQYATVIARYKPTVLSVVPPLMMFMANSDLVAPSDLNRVRFVTCGGAPATPALIQQFVKRANSKNLDFREGTISFR